MLKELWVMGHGALLGCRTSFDAVPLPFLEPQSQLLELREAVAGCGGQAARRIIGDEDISGRQASPSLPSSTYDLLQASL